MRAVRDLPLGADRPLVDLIYFDAGGGHRASATALKTAAEQQRRPWQIRLVNLRDVLERIDFVQRISGVRVEDFYNWMLKYGFTRCVNPMLPVMHLLIRRMHPGQVRTLAQYWMDRPPISWSLSSRILIARFSRVSAPPIGPWRAHRRHW